MTNALQHREMPQEWPAIPNNATPPFAHHDRGPFIKPATSLTNELRLFPSPWHWCVHGQGLGQLPTGFESTKAGLLLQIGNAVQLAEPNRFHDFTRALLPNIIDVCAGTNQANFHQVLALLPSDTLQYARACAVLTECLVKLGKLGKYNAIVHAHMDAALRRVEALTPDTPKGRYEKLQTISSLFLASGQAGWTDLLTSRPPQGISRIDAALRMTEEIPDLFYRGRIAALLITVVAALGYGYVVCGERVDYLRNLLDTFDMALDGLSMRVSDGVHLKADYSLFPLSLTLSAIAVLGRPAYLHYRRDWVQQAASHFLALPPPSRASQMIFYVYALKNLGVLEAQVPDLGKLLDNAIATYVQGGGGNSISDYLRCTYLIQMARQFGQTEALDPALWSILTSSLQRLRRLDSPGGYGSGYMVAAYTLSAFDAGNCLDLLTGGANDLPLAIASIMASAADTNLNLPKLDMALINAALQLRSAHVRDTRLFCDMKFSGESTYRHRQ